MTRLSPRRPTVARSSRPASVRELNSSGWKGCWAWRTAGRHGRAENPTPGGIFRNERHGPRLRSHPHAYAPEPPRFFWGFSPQVKCRAPQTGWQTSSAMALSSNSNRRPANYSTRFHASSAVPPTDAAGLVYLNSLEVSDMISRF